MLKALALAALPAMVACAASAQNANPGAPISNEQFVQQAAASDQFEIQEGKLAAAKGTGRVKQFGERMVRDHTRTSAELKAAAQKAGVQTPPAMLSPEQQAMMSQLQGLSGAEFDKTYMTQQVQAHKQAKDLLTDYEQWGQSAPLKAAARQAMAVVETHLRMAEKMAK
jgi:putative membrane protein